MQTLTTEGTTCVRACVCAAAGGWVEPSLWQPKGEGWVDRRVKVGVGGGEGKEA